ncbi:MAG: hypothetical protein CMO55_00750 [Verrucomicrobiales bacterium]|nr:hypothetical protein [Verrucomicrobiales bacterium]
MDDVSFSKRNLTLILLASAYFFSSSVLIGQETKKKLVRQGWVEMLAGYVFSQDSRKIVWECSRQIAPNPTIGASLLEQKRSRYTAQGLSLEKIDELMAFHVRSVEGMRSGREIVFPIELSLANLDSAAGVYSELEDFPVEYYFTKSGVQIYHKHSGKITLKNDAIGYLSKLARGSLAIRALDLLEDVSELEKVPSDTSVLFLGNDENRKRRLSFECGADDLIPRKIVVENEDGELLEEYLAEEMGENALFPKVVSVRYFTKPGEIQFQEKCVLKSVSEIRQDDVPKLKITSKDWILDETVDPPIKVQAADLIGEQ